MPRIEIVWGRHTTDLYYGPKCSNFKTYSAALTWAKEYKQMAEQQRPDVVARVYHYPTGRKNEKPILLEDIDNV